MDHPSPQPELTLLRGDRAQARSLSAGAAFASRSYADPWALVARHGGPVGVDIERVEPLDDAFCASICTPAERGRMRHAGPIAITALWSSKEALSKALGDAWDYDPRRLESPMFWPDGQAGRWRAQPLVLPEGYSGWLCWSAATAT